MKYSYKNVYQAKLCDKYFENLDSEKSGKQL